MRKLVFLVGFIALFLFLGITAMQEGMATQKNERVYTMLQKHIPYYLEKRVGGYSIVSKITGVKEKPPAKAVFPRLEQLEKMWAKDFLKLENHLLVVLDKNGNTVTKIELKNQKEISWVKEYFDLK